MGAYGKGLSRNDAVAVQQTIANFGALSAPTGIGMLLAGPTIAVHGSPDQIERYIRDVVTGQRAWCQLFSEPGAGSDLAGLQTKAIRDGDEWIVNGQKVWTSGAHVADMAILVARSNPDAPKHQGITYFAFDMHQPGVEVRPLREMTGRALFNEVFLTDARVEHAAVIGDVNNGWAVANTTLMFERAGLGPGGGQTGPTAIAGTVAGDLESAIALQEEAHAPGPIDNSNRCPVATFGECCFSDRQRHPDRNILLHQDLGTGGARNGDEGSNCRSGQTNRHNFLPVLQAGEPPALKYAF